MRNSILVVDDDPFLSDAIRKLFESHDFNVRVVGYADEAAMAVAKEKPDLMILDLGLPDQDGTLLCKKLRIDHNFPILMLTSRAGTSDKIHGLEVGADDYITKPFDSQELVARAKALMRRVSQYSSNSTTNSKGTSVGPLTIDEEARTVKVHDELLELTETEFKVMTMLVDNAGRALSRDSLFDSAWGYEINFNSNSLEVIVYRLRNKIKKAGGGDIIRTVRGYGYKLEV